jgi:excisionase family DNA binding protein
MNEMASGKGWLNVEEAARLLGVSARRIYQMTREGKLEAKAEGRRLFISKESVSQRRSVSMRDDRGLLIETLQDEIRHLQEELGQKNKQIEELHSQIRELHILLGTKALPESQRSWWKFWQK